MLYLYLIPTLSGGPEGVATGSKRHRKKYWIEVAPAGTEFTGQVVSDTGVIAQAKPARTINLARVRAQAIRKRIIEEEWIVLAFHREH